MSTAQVNNVTQFGGSDTAASVVVPWGDTSKLICLYAGGGAAISSTAVPLYKDGVAYQVPAGKTFRVIGVSGFAPSAATGQLLTDTVTFAYAATLASLTAPVYQGGGQNQLPIPLYSGVANQWVHTKFTYAAFTQNLFPGLNCNAPGNTGITVMGYEE